MMALSWARRARELHDELAAITDVSGFTPTWWLVAATAATAERLPARAHYVASDAEASGDTFIGHRSPPPSDPIADAIVRAHAARAALRELDGQLPDQPLAVTIQRGDVGARVVPSSLDVAAFYRGDLAEPTDDAAIWTDAARIRAAAEAAVAAHASSYGLGDVRLVDAYSPDGYTVVITLEVVSRPLFDLDALLPWTEGVTFTVTSAARFHVTAYLASNPTAACPSFEMRGLAVRSELTLEVTYGFTSMLTPCGGASMPSSRAA